MPGEKASDESHSFDSTTQFRVGLLQVLDTIIMQIEERFVALKEVVDDFGFLNGVSIETTTLDKIKKQATDLALKYSADLNAYEFTSIIESFKLKSKILYENVIEMGILEILQGQQRLTNISIISIQKSTAINLNYDEIMNIFDESKSRKVVYLMSLCD
ncbi:unnamed protein product [Psylliodes chrysocephalus]|uniref:Uncharacterized protein n=1 Tax=Psylliodes chrysocephalus TaxID=3402493 RepID=A0A9P0GF40_9CUCU|nr:unnamed protein product [Psylliodes chrysocephala]